MIYFLCLFVIPMKNLLFIDISKCIHFLKFNSFIKPSFLLRSERSMYIKDFNSACISISSHSRAARSFFLFAFYRRFSSYVFLLSGGCSGFFDEDVHPLTSSLYLSIGLFVLHLLLPMSSSSLMFFLYRLNFHYLLSYQI